MVKNFYYDFVYSDLGFVALVVSDTGVVISSPPERKLEESLIRINKFGYKLLKDENKNMKYVGEIEEGEKQGQGIEYYENGDIKYKGEWEEGKYHEEGIKYYDNENKMYEGEFKKGIQNGRGIFYYIDGSNYKGIWKDGIPHEQGIDYFLNINNFKGEFKDKHMELSSEHLYFEN